MFCIFGAATALLGTGNMAQSNTIVRTFVEAAAGFGWQVSPWVPGIIITAAVGAVLLGGIHRIASVAEKLVPTMLVIYLGMALTYLLMNLSALPGVFGVIFEHAFSPHAAAGGFLGVTVRQAIAAGISRGVLSNEAGLGSAPIAHGIAQVKHPADQGLVGVFEVFVDTIVVCSMTAFAILSSGLWTAAEYQGASGDLTAAAFSTTFGIAPVVIAISSFLFGFSTIIGWYYYGETCWEYLFGSRASFLPGDLCRAVAHRRPGDRRDRLECGHPAQRVHGLPEPDRAPVPRRHRGQENQGALHLRTPALRSGNADAVFASSVA